MHAAVAAACFAGASVSSKRGLQRTTVVTGVIVTLGTTFAVLLPAAALDPPARVTIVGLSFLMVGGLVSPGLARWASTSGLRSLGPSVAVPLQHGAHPLFAILGGALLLDEDIGIARLLGASLIIFGGVRLSGAPRTEDDPPAGTAAYLRPGALYSVLAGACYAASTIIFKQALDRIPSPAFAAMVGTGTSFFVWLAIGTTLGRDRAGIRRGAGGLGWFVLAGLLIAVAFLNYQTALIDGDVSLVGPIMACEPLAVFLLVHLFLKDLDALNAGTIVAGALVVGGAVLLAA